MTGPGHYQEAERLLTVCAGDKRGTPLDVACTAAAQVHATLALAAAVAVRPAVCVDELDAEWAKTLYP
jgi:hypothetical protein